MDHGRRNSDNTKDHLQYHTPRGNITHKVVVAEIARAPPATPRNPVNNMPHRYMNREGDRPNQYPLFESRELPQRRINPTRTGPVPLYEYPVTTPNKPSFDYSRASREQQAAIAPHERAMMLEPENRPNDVGFMRGITGPDKKVVGAIYHPAGDRRGFARAELEPLDRQGREHNRMLHDRAQHAPRSPTWPTRSS
ncbi:b3295504-0a91-4b52-b2f5-4940c0ebd9e2 [Sclerotinia trifoliorum]|uniref:B3295504-0a91-4b52-b2f5-4940c0ebd9e2 n=1 Tax=Sclerotinia trifoliorum TaxID=28548 RepID=A0A8H2VUR8_9HELO|nr:b3295504-0a91-4b52-b2f5-4940c0ebd9e2 [Sclerotinia trifoliorum]